MKAALSQRGRIPFFYKKSDKEFQLDPYERYESMVSRQSALHLADGLWDSYPMQAVLDFAAPFYPSSQVAHILEIGCGVGRWIATLAQTFPKADCWGIDYSYQMLKRAREFWVDQTDIHIDLSSKGFSNILNIKGHRLKNLNFGLAKASALPFNYESQDLIINSFLLDRLDDPARGLAEMYRVLRPKGKLILITPLNFSKAAHWKAYYPPIKLFQLLGQIGFEVLDWQEEILINEPLDFHGNSVRWKCIGFAAQRKD